MGNTIRYIDLEFVMLIYAFRNGNVSFSVVPKEKKSKVSESKLLKNNTSQYFYIDNMIQVASRNDSVKRNFSHGQTLFNSSSSSDLNFIDQKIIKKEDGKDILTIFRSNQYEVTHVVSTKYNYQAFTIHNEIKNIGDEVYLDRLDSFTINTVTPFTEPNDPSSMYVHTLESFWSMEARRHSEPLSNYNFRDSWSKLGLKIFKISSLGLMPARGYHPFIAIEDKKNDVTWAVQLKNPDSWQIEAIHNYGSVTITGGHSDYLNGHWEKLLKPGEIYKTEEAVVSVVNGELDEACLHLTRFHDFFIKSPSQEEDLPIIFNEYLYSWGHPNIVDIKKEMELAKDLDVKEFVVDAGWFLDDSLQCEGLLGDWSTNKQKFPKGLKELRTLANKNDMHTCGIWYEFEAVTVNSNLYKEHPEYLATSNGKIITLDKRCFLDFNKDEVIEYLRKKVIDNVVKNNLNYIKLDYNENIGFEMDGPSINKAENVRTHVYRLLSFINEIRIAKPDLVFETCSSGGMRHEISFDYIGSMTSFSDAHEILGGVAIAMDMHRIMQPRIMQIWASLLPNHSYDYLFVTLGKGMLGRLCYSGKIDQVESSYFELAKRASAFYKKLVPIIKEGDTTMIDTDEITDFDNPRGKCSLVRKSRDGTYLVYYLFNFNSSVDSVSFPFEGYQLVDSFSNLLADNSKVLFVKRLGVFVGLFRRR